MDFLIMGLIIGLIVILLIPTNEEDESGHNLSENHCEIHSWVSKETGLEDNSRYTQCSTCLYLPETGNYGINID